MSESEASEIAQQILLYLQKHPEAQDTLDGIVEWWLPTGKMVNTAIIGHALDKLLAAGLISMHQCHDSMIYRLEDNWSDPIDDVVVERESKKKSKT